MTLTAAARRWVEEVLGEPVVGSSTLTGGVASRMLLLRTADGPGAVLKQLVSEPYRSHAEGLLTRERDVQRMLAGASGIPVPAPLALDASGAATGDPSLLMTRLDGAIDLVDGSPRRVAALAALLLRIHRFRPDRAPRHYQSWATEAKMRVPPWSTDDPLYVEAFDRLRAGPPPYEPTFLHRDFHPGNVLWSAGHDDEVSGVVDWCETSTGPADLDVAHCTSNLANLHGVDVALAFRKAYVDQGGVLAQDADAASYWQLLDLVGFLPDASGRESGAPPAAGKQVWDAHRRPDLTVATVRRRREDLLRAVLRPAT